MSERGLWLKSVGAAEPGLEQAEDWPDTAPQELHEVHFPDKGKPSVKVGDYLVYYASGQARIIGIVEVHTPPSKDSGEDRWPWRCQVRPRIIINRISRSPSIDAMSGPQRALRDSVQQQSHISLTEDEYDRALHALEEAFDPGQGDRLFPWFSFATRLRQEQPETSEAFRPSEDEENPTPVGGMSVEPGQHLVGEIFKDGKRTPPGRSIGDRGSTGHPKN